MMPTGPMSGLPTGPMPGMPQAQPQGGLGGPAAPGAGFNPDQGVPGGGGADGGMDLNALMSLLGGGSGAPNAGAPAGAPTAPGGGGGRDLMSLLGGAPQGAGGLPGAGPAGGAPQGAGQFTWGPDGSVIANNTGGGFTSGLSNMNPRLLATAAVAVGLGALLAFRKKGDNTEVTEESAQPQQQFKTTLEGAAQVEAAMKDEALDQATKSSRVAEFREGLKEYLAAMKADNAVLLEQPQRAELKETFDHLEKSLAGLNNDHSPEQFTESVAKLTEQFGTLERELGRQDEEAAASSESPATPETSDAPKADETKTDKDT